LTIIDDDERQYRSTAIQHVYCISFTITALIAVILAPCYNNILRPGLLDPAV